MKPSLQSSLAHLLPPSAQGVLDLKKILEVVLEVFQSESGTIHVLDDSGQVLRLVAEKGLPQALLGIIESIPLGKGIAGQVALENRPVTLCNLQTDTSGVARPGARQSGMGGSLCVPMRKEGRVVGTLGIGTLREYEYSALEINELQNLANQLAAACAEYLPPQKAG